MGWQRLSGSARGGRHHAGSADHGDLRRVRCAAQRPSLQGRVYPRAGLQPDRQRRRADPPQPFRSRRAGCVHPLCRHLQRHLSIAHRLSDGARTHLPDHTDTNLAMTESTDAGSARERALWYGHAMEQLVEVVQRLSMARDLATVMDIVKHAARALTGADGATFVLRDGDKCFYADEDAISPLWKGQRFPMDICISGWAMLNRQPAVIEDIYADSRIPADAYRPTFVKSLAMVPIRTLDPVGAIGNYWAERHQPSPEQVKVLQALADTTAVALENVQVYAELEKRVRERTLELETILDNIQVGVVFSTHNRIERANPKTADLFGTISHDALACTPFGSLLQPAGCVTLCNNPKQKRAPSEIFDTDIQLKRQAVPFWAHVVHKPLDPELYPDGAIRMIDDLSAAKEKVCFF